jgi:hypothetical protein
VVEHKLQAVVEEEVAALQRRGASPQRREQLGGLAGRAQGDERGDARVQHRRELPAHPGDDAERPLRSHQQRAQVVASVVLAQTGESRDDRAIGQHRLEPGHVGPGGAVAQRASAPGIAGHHSPDGARVAGGKVEARVLTGGARSLLQRRQRRPGADRDLSDGGVDIADFVDPLEREDDLAGPGNARSDQTGISALRHDRRLVVGAGRHHAGHLGGVAWADDQPGATLVATGVVALIGRGQLRIAQHVPRADDLPKCLFKGVHRG